jgi:peptidoglycan/LPS O-acetylase OafA/YrhL
MQGSEQPRAEKSLIGLELTRFACAILVLLWHYQHFFYVDAELPLSFKRTMQPAYGLLWPGYEYGFLAVPVFWTLSGFIFFYKYGQAVAAHRIAPMHFARLRFSRLYPLHLATLLVVAALQWLYTRSHAAGYVYDHQDLKHFVLQLVLASNWGFEQGSSFNGPIWSISVEIVVYAIFYLFARSFAGTRLPTMVAMVVVPAALVGLHVSENYILRCVLFFYLGGLTFRSELRLRALPIRLQWALLAASTAVLMTLIALVPQLRRVPPIMLAVGIAPLFLLIVLRAVRPRSARVASVIVALGNTTYSSYLIHFPIQLIAVLACSALGAAVPAGETWFLLAFLAASFGLAVPTYRAFEIPAQDWLRKRLAPSSRAVAADAPPATPEVN